MTTSVRDAASNRTLLETVRNKINCAQALIVTSLPRGDLQVVQPLSVGEELVRLYARGYHAEDRLTWQSVLRQQPLRAEDCWTAREFDAIAYVQEWLRPAGLAHVAAAPLAAPLLAGYPGAIHVCRTTQQGAFSQEELRTLARLAGEHDARVEAARGSQPTASCERNYPALARPRLKFAIVDARAQARYPEQIWDKSDPRLRQQMVDQAQHRASRLNGSDVEADRILLPDSHGDNWAYRIVTYNEYPALGDGPFNFFCLQPDCAEWGMLRSSDLQADQELARMLPAIRFMQEQFARGPTLVSIAKTVDLSAFHFHRRFSELFGMTPKQFLLECQINQAKRELLAREKELSLIAKDCGFAHQSHFTSRFKQATGLTPTRWRKMATERGKTSEN